MVGTAPRFLLLYGSPSKDVNTLKLKLPFNFISVMSLQMQGAGEILTFYILQFALRATETDDISGDDPS